MSASRDHSALEFGECVWACADAAPADSLPEEFRDNVYGHCDVCTREIMWRPHALGEATKLCMGCARAIATALAKAGEPPALAMTGETMAEVIEAHGPEGLMKRAEIMAKFMYGKGDD